MAEDFIGEVRVCTVFLGLDLNEDLAPLELFETMIYGGPHDRYYMRYATWDEAEAGHKIAVALCHATNHSGAGLSRPMLKLRSKQGTYDGQH